MEENNAAAVEETVEAAEIVAEMVAGDSVAAAEIVEETADDEQVETTAKSEDLAAEETVEAEAVSEDIATEEVVEAVPAPAEPGPTSIDELAPKMKVNGKVLRLELYGAFIDIGLETNALIHISKLAKDHVNRVSDVLQVGDDVTVWIEKVNPEQGQIMVSMIEPLDVEWGDLKKGQTFTGTVTRLENYGAFVDVGAEREGLVHISEISHDYVKQPGDLLKVGEQVDVQVLDFNRRKRRIDLSIKNLQEKPESQQSTQTSQAPSASAAYQEADDFEEPYEEVPTAMEVALRKAMGDEPIDAVDDEYNRRRRSNKGRRKRRRHENQDEILDRTMQFEYDS